jgi:hypothetical protein
MVKNSRATSRSAAVRSLNTPRPVLVETKPSPTGDLLPVALIERERRRPVMRIEDFWLIDDEWWLRRLQRRYFRVVVEGEIRRTIYHDPIGGDWYAQGY